MNDPKPPVTTPDGIVHDTPVPSSDSDRRWGSDAIAETLRRLELPYIALNPGASYRGLHDSIVNYLGNKAPQMLLCLHDEHAVHIAQGYAKVTDRMMAAALHSNVGLMHATMPVFDAWCDRVPVMVIGANGPWDAARRRPWIDWIHTCTDQAALVRDFTKWDNQPASVPAAIEALLRASQIAQTAPRGPVYVNLDVSLQDALDARHGPLPACRSGAPFRRPGGACRAAALRGEASGAALRPGVAKPRGVEHARGLRREAPDAGGHQHQARRGLPHQPPPARGATGQQAGAGRPGGRS
jgi:hypothetical protein